MKNKKLVKKSRLTPLQKVLFLNALIYYFLWVQSNEDLVDPFVLEIEEPIPVKDDKKKTQKRKVYHLNLHHSKPAKKVPKENSRVFKFSLSLVLFISLVVIAQVLYPSGKTLPFAKLESAGYMGFADDQKILSALADFDSRIVTVHTQTKNITTSYKDLGVTIDPKLTSETMTDYPLSKRLVPFSLFFHGVDTYQINRSINDSQLELFVDNVIALASKKPVNALVTLENGEFKVSPSEEGYEYQTSSLKSSVLQADLSDKAQLVFTPTILYPDISSEIAQTNAIRMQKRINNPLSVNADGKTINFDKATLASWIDIEHKPVDKTVNITFSPDKVSQSLSSFPAVVNYPAKPAVTTLLNGNRVGREEGKTGRQLEYDQLVKQVVDTTSPATNTVEATVITLIPEELIDRRYTKDSAGVQSLLDYWTSTNSGFYGIDFRTLNGRISANVNSNRIFTAVGIHKTYIAGLIYNRVAGGSLNFDSITQSGETVDFCLYKMVSLSDEPCTVALGNIVGWSVSDQLLKSQGFESTTLTQNASLSSPNDATDWLIKLSNANITTVQHSYLLTELMANQSIRSGIPSGLPGYRVENKSGAYGRFINDIALVYHGGGDYALSIMSEGSSYQKISELSYEINKVMSQ